MANDMNKDLARFNELELGEQIATLFVTLWQLTEKFYDLKDRILDLEGSTADLSIKQTELYERSEKLLDHSLTNAKHISTCMNAILEQYKQ